MAEEKIFYTFVVAPSAKGQFHRFSIKYTYLYTAVGLLLGIILIFSVSSIWVFSHGTDIAALSKLKKDNLELNNLHLTDQNRIEKLKARVNNIEDQAKKLSKSSGLQYAEDIDTNIGHGGPSDTFDVVEKNAEHLE